MPPHSCVPAKNCVHSPLIKLRAFSSYTPGFANHALAGAEQMSLLEALPYSLCQPGPAQVDGVGNYYLQIFETADSQVAASTLYLVDSHGQAPSNTHNPDYKPIKQTQID